MLIKTHRFLSFSVQGLKRVKQVSINAFRGNGKTRSGNAFLSEKFAPWVAMNILICNRKDRDNVELVVVQYFR